MGRWLQVSLVEWVDTYLNLAIVRYWLTHRSELKSSNFVPYPFSCPDTRESVSQIASVQLYWNMVLCLYLDGYVYMIKCFFFSFFSCPVCWLLDLRNAAFTWTTRPSGKLDTSLPSIIISLRKWMLYPVKYSHFDSDMWATDVLWQQMSLCLVRYEAIYKCGIFVYLLPKEAQGKQIPESPTLCGRLDGRWSGAACGVGNSVGMQQLGF